MQMMSKVIKEIPEGYMESAVGIIPVDWEVKELNDEIEILEAGVSVNSSDEEIGVHNMFILKTSAVLDGRFFPTERKKITMEDISRAKLNPQKNSIIISRMNTPDLVGECGYVDKTYLNLFLPDRLWQTKFNPESTINVKWLNFLLNTPEYKLKIKSTATGTSNSMKNISKNSFLSIKIPVPTKQEQEAIAFALNSIEDSIYLVNHVISKKELQKKALMQQLLTGKKRIKGFENEWKKSGAGEIFKSITKKGYDNEELLSVTQESGIIPRSMLSARVTMPSGETGSFKLVEKGDFVISLRSFQGGLEYSNYKGLVSPAYTVLKPKRKINDGFYKQYFKSYDFIGHLATAVIGIRDGKQISYDDYCLVKIPSPPIEEQTAIANILQTADQEIQLLKAKAEKLKAQKRGMMQQLLTGKKRLKPIEI